MEVGIEEKIYLQSRRKMVFKICKELFNMGAISKEEYVNTLLYLLRQEGFNYGSK